MNKFKNKAFLLLLEIILHTKQLRLIIILLRLHAHTIQILSQHYSINWNVKVGFCAFNDLDDISIYVLKLIKC